MTEDILDRTAVDRRLRELSRERMQGRKLVGVKFDAASKTWLAILKDRWLPIRTTTSVGSDPTYKKARATRARLRVPARKK